MQNRTDEQVFALLRTVLYTAVIGDILDREKALTGGMFTVLFRLRPYRQAEIIQ
jgi:hypothetical protein